MILMMPAKADVLLDIINGNYAKYEVVVDSEANDSYENQHGNSDSEPQHYSWDNLYLCNYCGIEVIVDPYAEQSKDEILFDY
jgi:hypothetical protein